MIFIKNVIMVQLEIGYINGVGSSGNLQAENEYYNLNFQSDLIANPSVTFKNLQKTHRKLNKRIFRCTNLTVK